MTNKHLVPAMIAMSSLREWAAHHMVVNKKLRYKETALFFRDLMFTYAVLDELLYDKVYEDFWEED